MKVVFWLGIFNANILLTFQGVKNPSAYPTYVRFGLFCKLFGDFWLYLGMNSVSQRISKTVGNRKFERFDIVFKLEFKLKISTPGMPPSGDNQLSGGVPKLLFYF